MRFFKVFSHNVSLSNKREVFYNYITHPTKQQFITWSRIRLNDNPKNPSILIINQKTRLFLLDSSFIVRDSVNKKCERLNDNQCNLK